jgi:hypothetical protein
LTNAARSCSGVRSAADALALDPPGDEVLADLLEDRPPLIAVGRQQCLAAPALQPRRKFPAEVGRILQSIVQAEAAIGRMAVRGVAGDERPAGLILIGHRDAQVPEADVIVFSLEREAGHPFHQAVEVEILALGTARQRRVEKEPSPTSMRPKNSQ